MQDIKGSSHVHKNIDHPIGTFLYTVSCMHCMTVSLAQGGEGLGAMWGEEKTREYLQRAGFRSVETSTSWRTTSRTTGTWSGSDVRRSPDDDAALRVPETGRASDFQPESLTPGRRIELEVVRLTNADDLCRGPQRRLRASAPWRHPSTRGAM